MKKINVVAAIICKNDLIFATQRGYGEFKGQWEFPGGKVEEGEAPEDAIIREIHEELNTEIAIDEYLHTVEYDYLAFHKYPYRVSHISLHLMFHRVLQ